jgi:hypothetical protein
MTVPEILASFARDTQVHAAIVLIAADVIFGVLAAFKLKTFRLIRIADTLRDDVFFKVAPWLALFALGKVSDADVAGIDFANIADVAWAGVVLALGASILGSVRDLGVNVPEVVAGDGTTPHS